LQKKSLNPKISYKYIWLVTFPVILSLLAQNFTNLIDTVFLGRVGEVELGASAIGGILYFTLFTIGFGFSIGSQILISRRNGEQKYKDIGAIFEKTIYFLLIIGLFIIIFTLFISPLLMKKVISSPNIYKATFEFLDYRIWGIFFAFINTAFRAFYVGIIKTKYLTYSAIIIAIVNITLDYMLIFGNFGFPEMGISGAAIASVIAEFCSVVFFIIITLMKIDLKKYGLFIINKNSHGVIKSVFNISVWIMLQNFVSLSAWFVFFLIIEQTGEHQLAISNIARSVYIFLLIPIFGFSTSINTITSNLIGEKREHLVTAAVRKTVFLCLGITVIALIPSFAFTDSIAGLFTKSAVLISDSIGSLHVIFTSILLASVAWVLFNSVTGTGNTKIAMIIEFITIVLYLFTVYILAIVFKQSLTVVWLSEIIYFIFIGSLSYLYLKKGNWKKISI
jgi:putative MATE family efflux protein